MLTDSKLPSALDTGRSDTNHWMRSVSSHQKPSPN
jgi:hypothetical protein